MRIGSLFFASSSRVNVKTTTLPGLDGADLAIDATRLGAPAGAREQCVRRRHAEADERLQLEGHQPVHAVGPAREPDARGEVTREAFGDDTAGPANLVHDGGAVAVAL